MKPAFGLFLYSDMELKPLVEEALFGFRCEKKTTAPNVEVLRLAEDLLQWKYPHYLPGDALRLAYVISLSIPENIPDNIV